MTRPFPPTSKVYGQDNRARHVLSSQQSNSALFPRAGSADMEMRRLVQYQTNFIKGQNMYA